MTTLGLMILLISSLLFQAGEPLTPGEPIRGEIAETGETDVYLYTSEGNETVSITVTAEGELDATLELIDPDAELLAENDDATPDNTNPALEMSLAEAGTYEIRVAAFAGASTGTYEILLQLNAAQPIPSETVEPTPSSSETDLELGDLLRGELEVDAVDVYTLTANQSGAYQIVMFSNRFDTMLQVYDETGQLVTEDDDSGGGTNAAITRLELEAGQQVEIHAMSYSSGSGEYIISVSAAPEVPPVVAIAYGDTVDGSIVAGVSADFTFEASAGDVFSAMVNAEFDSYILLLDDAGNILMEDDDTGGDLQGAILNFPLTQAGTYTLRVEGYNAFEQGSFSLSLEKEEAGAIPATGTIAYGETVIGSLTSAAPTSYSFTGSEDDTIFIQVEADFDTTLELYAPDGSLLAQDDDSAGRLNPLIQVRLPASGEYRVDVNSFDPASEGTFEITLGLDGSEPTVTPEAPVETPVPGANTGEVLETFEGDLAAGEVATYTFSAQSGDIVTIRVHAEFDSYLELSGPDGQIVISDDDSGGDFNPLIENSTLPATGDYTLALSGFSADTSGAFQISVESGGTGTNTTNPEETPVAPPTESVVILPDETLTQTMTDGVTNPIVFNGSVGERVSIAAAPVDPSSQLDLYIELLQPNGDLLATDDDSAWLLNPALPDIELPEDGTYTIQVRSFDGNGSGDYVVSLGPSGTHFAPSGEVGQELVFENGSATLELPSGTVDGLYSFTAEAGQILTLVSAAEDVAVALYGSANIAEEPLVVGGVYELFEAATYHLILSGSGAVEFTLGGVTAEVTPATPEAPVVPTVVDRETVAVDVPIRGTLNEAEIHNWRFTPLFTGDYTFVLHAEDAASGFDPYLTLLDDAGNILAEDDDSGGNFDAVLTSVPLTAGQVTVIQVRGFAEQSGGAYLLAVVADTVEEPEALEGGTLSLDAPLTSALDLPSQQAEFDLTVTAEGLYTLSIEGLKLPYIEIYDGAGTLLGRGAAVLRDQLLTPGDYRVVVFDRLNRTGEFTLTVQTAGE
jgi:PKD repeat protein